MQTAYGHNVESSDDFYVQLAETALRVTAESGKHHEGRRPDNANFQLGPPGWSLVDLIPALRHLPTWIPGFDELRRAQEAQKHVMVCHIFLYSYEFLSTYYS